MRWLKKLWEWVEHASTIQGLLQTEFVRTALWPVVSTMLTGAGGYLQHAPLIWIATACAMVFMGVSVGWVALDVNRERKSPQNKLTYTPLFQCDLDSAPVPAEGNRTARRAKKSERHMLSPTELHPKVMRHLIKGQIGIEIKNNAPFPISVVLTASKTEIEGETPPRSEFPKTPAIIAPWSTVRMTDDPIELDERPCGRLAGKIDMTVMYGFPGKEKYELKVVGLVDVGMEQYGFVSNVRIGQ